MATKKKKVDQSGRQKQLKKIPVVFYFEYIYV